MRRPDPLVSPRILHEGLKVLSERIKAEAPFVPDYVTRREERLVREFRGLIEDAGREYLSSSAVADLTGWDAGTLRKYARKAIVRATLPDEWSGLVVRRDGKEFGFLLSSVPPKAKYAIGGKR